MSQDGSTKLDPGDARSVAQIARSVAQDFQDFVRAELQLAGAELKEKAGQYGKALAILAAAGLLVFFAFACLVTACIAALALVLPVWLAALIPCVLLGFLAGGAFLVGRIALDKLDPLPTRALAVFWRTVERIANSGKPAND